MFNYTQKKITTNIFGGCFQHWFSTGQKNFYVWKKLALTSYVKYHLIIHIGDLSVNKKLIKHIHT